MARAIRGLDGIDGKRWIERINGLDRFEEMFERSC